MHLARIIEIEHIDAGVRAVEQAQPHEARWHHRRCVRLTVDEQPVAGKPVHHIHHRGIIDHASGGIEPAVLQNQRQIIDTIFRRQTTFIVAAVRYMNDPGQTGIDLRRRPLMDMRVVPDGRRVLGDRHLGAPCFAGCNRKVRTTVMRTGHHEAMPVQADRFLQLIGNLGRKIAVLHDDCRPQIVLVEPCCRHGGATEKAAAACHCGQRKPTACPRVKNRGHGQASRWRISLTKDAQRRHG